MTCKAYLLFQSIANFMEIPEMRKKNGKIVFDFEIIAFELIVLDTRF